MLSLGKSEDREPLSVSSDVPFSQAFSHNLHPSLVLGDFSLLPLRSLFLPKTDFHLPLTKWRKESSHPLQVPLNHAVPIIFLLQKQSAFYIHQTILSPVLLCKEHEVTNMKSTTPCESLFPSTLAVPEVFLYNDFSKYFYH